MLDMLMFAIIFVSVQLIGGFIATVVAMKYFMSKRYIKKMTKTMNDIVKEAQEEMLDDF
jgi:uncharacterized protein YneF (UPF0154 family)